MATKTLTTLESQNKSMPMASATVYLSAKERAAAVKFIRELSNSNFTLHQWVEQDNKLRLWFWVGLKIREGRRSDYYTGMAVGILNAADFIAIRP